MRRHDDDDYDAGAAERAEQESWEESLADPVPLAPWENDVSDEFDEWLAGHWFFGNQRGD